jgi:hypothetical protein
MSRAFVREDENDLAELADRPISLHRNFVIEAGLRRLRPLSTVSRRRTAPQHKGLDPTNARKVDFYTRQFVDATTAPCRVAADRAGAGDHILIGLICSS